VADLAPVGELQAMAGRMAAMRWGIRSFGDPSRLAGDPGALRALAGSHRDLAGELLSAADAGRGQATALVAGAWQGPASGAFCDYWTVVDGQVRDLATRHTRVAKALDDIAASAEHLNRQVAEVAGAADAWLGAATTAIATMDVGAAPGLVNAAFGILSRWGTLLPELEAFAAGLTQRMDVDLGVRLPEPGLPVLPGRPGILITMPCPTGPRVLIDTPPPELPRGPDLPPGPTGPSVVYDNPAEPGIPDPSEIPPGSTPEDVIEKLPPEIVAGGGPSRKGGGVRYPDPNRPGDQLIIEPGDPSADDPLHQGPYVKISKGGTVTRIPLAGNPSL
jgi:uncharacterized protein YukE